MAVESSRARQTVVLLDADVDLAAGLNPEHLDQARRHSVAHVLEIDGPEWDPDQLGAGPDDGWLGLFVLEGLIMRTVSVGKRSSCELFGPGDMLRPWDTDGDYDPLPIAVGWSVPRPTQVALLDSAFALRIARWPTITARLVSRVAQRARCLALTAAVTHLPRTYQRLLMQFWLLAERFGKVSPDGVYVTLPLTHEVLAMLVGSHRPTVTIALGRLSEAGLLKRERSDRWLLTNRAIEYLGQPESLVRLQEEEED